MYLSIQSNNITLNSLAKENIKKRARRVFSRVEDKIDKVLINVKDVNGPKGGPDKLCKVIIESTVSSTIVVTNRKQNLAAAVDLALTKACFNLTQKMKRRKGKKVKSMPDSTLEV
ncbi:hypothetical protein [Pleionea sediminis]|uniref:hypothetical protein n=1 Tax=Pleionea sediminis TaxID=2569479 RepID=UPI0011846B99|nr:hypothetical protein [Pleionea sediminis]